jgi:alpha-mannosidase
MLTKEWKRRVDNWRQELPNHVYRPLGALPVNGFLTYDQLTAEEASQGEFEPMPVGTKWGAKWEYGWFKGQVVLPEAAAGKRIVLQVDVGAESAVYVDGVAVGAASPPPNWLRRHQAALLYREILLAQSGVPGATYEIMVEGYAGHGPRKSYAGPIPPGRQSVPEPPPTQAAIGQSSFGVWQEDVYQLAIDVETLYEVRENLDPDSLRVMEIDAGLRDFTAIVDFELPNEEMLETVRACRERLKPLLECVNGSTAPTMYAFGHAHIDVAWLWPLAETERKCVRTFASQLALMEQYPEFKFLQSQPHLYWMVKTHYPKLYERIKKAVRSGQFLAEGGMWVEADTNISGGESLIRQFVHGRRFFVDEFGVDCELMWLPDVFGYSGAMPQIMVGCGIKYFSTQKIFWAYNSDVTFPLNTFWWEGIDGSQILVHLHNDYNSRTNPASVIQRWKERVQKDGFATRLLPFGWGDGGGGPTRNHLEFLRRQVNLEGVPKVVIASPIDYFKDQERKPVPHRYVGELYFQAHRGTYTSQAKTKRGNRRSEFALREAEMWGVAAQALKGYVYPLERMDGAWKAVLLNQFHDIIPGSSIARVYEEAEAAYADVIARANDVTAQATAALAADDTATDIDRTRSRLILSDGAAQRELRKQDKEQLLAELQEGDIRKGQVVSLCDFGAFVDLGGADGLVHLSELSWRRVSHPSEVLQVGDEVEVYVLNIDRDRRRIGLSLKRLESDPRSTIAERYHIDQLVEGTITKGDALTVFNSLSWPRAVLVALPGDWYGAKDEDGLLTTQNIDGTAYVEVTVPPCGWTTIYAEDPLAMASSLQATPTLLENDLLRVAFNERGEITSMLDKESGRELAAGTCNSLKMYKDVPTNWDAWDLDSMYEDTPVALDGPAAVTVLASGPLVARVQVRRTLNQSEMTQTIGLRQGSRRVDFHTVIDWRESHKLLKVNFPVNIYNTEALHEIQFGHIARPTHKSRPFDADRFEVCNHKWTALTEGNCGVAVLNDCKYGVNVDGASINLTLLKSALAPDMNADKGRQEFTYALYAWNGPFFDSGLVREGYDLNIDPVTAAGDGGQGSLFSVDAPNVIVETVKPAEDGSGDVIVRLYESMRAASRCTLSTSLPVSKAVQTNMLEEHEGDLELQEGKLPLEFRPFEVKTVRFS